MRPSKPSHKLAMHNSSCERSQNHGFLILAEDAAKRIRDFADGCKVFDRFKDDWKQIFVVGGASIQLGKRRRSFCGSRGTAPANERSVRAPMQSPCAESESEQSLFTA